MKPHSDGSTQRLGIAVTGHRLAHPALAGRASAVEEALRRLFKAVSDTGVNASKVTLRSLLADGADQNATRLAISNGWSIEATLPFGLALTCAIGAGHEQDDAGTKRALLREAEESAKSRVSSHTPAIRAFMDVASHARVDALPEQDDERYAALWIAASNGMDESRLFAEEASHRYALAARRVLDQSDLLVAVWDGASSSAIGGTGHTVQEAVTASIPVIWIEPAAPDYVRLLAANVPSPPVAAALAVAEALRPR
ncbi:MAG: hypothetical protein ABL871_04305 [Terricaulis sp.]